MRDDLSHAANKPKPPAPPPPPPPRPPPPPSPQPGMIQSSGKSRDDRSRELTDAYVIKWEFDQDVWGVALKFSNGDQHNYHVGSYKEAMREMLRVLKQAEHA